jgi:hypothetical protein
VHRFAESLAGVLGLTAAFQHVTACPQTWQLGTYIPLSGHSYPAYLTIQDSPDLAYAVAVRLAGIAAGPLLLFMPTRRVIDPVTSELVTRSQSRLIALEGRRRDRREWSLGCATTASRAAPRVPGRGAWRAAHVDATRAIPNAT